jgi:tetratricopeptide (TPR) repeat protein
MAEHRIHAAVGAANACLLKTEPNRAAVYCRRGLELDPVHQPLRRLLAQASQYAGDYGGAEATLSSLAEFERASGRPQEHAETLLALAQLRRDQGHLESAMRGARTAMDIGERCGQIAVVAESASVLSSILRRLGRYGEALEAAKSAHRAATEAGLASEAIRATIHIATALVEQGSLAAARESALYGTRQAERTGYLFGAAWVATIAGITQMEAGDTSSAAPLLEGALDVSERIHGHIGMASALHHLGWNAWLRGEAAEDAFIRAREVASRISYCAVQYPAAFGFALCSGDLEGSERALREIEALNMGAIVPWLREKRGAWLVKQGLWEDALRDLAPAYRVARRLGMRMLQARAAAGLADAYSGMGDSMAEAMRHEAEDLRAECVADW